MAIIPGSVRFTGFIAPTDSTDTYAVTDPKWGLGGLRRVSGITERDLISTERRESGMLVYSEYDDIYYKLGTGLTNSDWSIFMTGKGSSAFLSLSGGTVTGVTEFTASIVSNVLSGGTFYSGSTDIGDLITLAGSQDLQSVMTNGPTSNISGQIEIVSSGSNIFIKHDNNSGVINGFTSTPFSAIMQSSNLSGETILSLNASSDSYIYDSANSAGIKYFSDYSLQGINLYGDRWIPDYGAVKNAIINSDFLPISGGTVTGDTTFTTQINLTSTSTPQLIVNPVNVSAPIDGSMWFTTSGGTTFLNYQVSGVTKSVELT